MSPRLEQLSLTKLLQKLEWSEVMPQTLYMECVVFTHCGLTVRDKLLHFPTGVRTRARFHIKISDACHRPSSLSKPSSSLTPLPLLYSRCKILDEMERFMSDREKRNPRKFPHWLHTVGVAKIAQNAKSPRARPSRKAFQRIEL